MPGGTALGRALLIGGVVLRAVAMILALVGRISSVAGGAATIHAVGGITLLLVDGKRHTPDR